MRITSSMAARIVLTILAVLLVGTGSAFADSCASTSHCIYDLDTVNSTSALGTLSSYGTVDLSLSAGKINFIVSLVSGYRLFGGFGFDSSISPDPGSLSVTNSSDTTNWPNGTLTLGSNQFDGFGSFEYAFDGPNSQTNGTQTLSFTVSNGAAFTDVHQLVEGSTGGGSLVPSIFAAHIFNGNGGCGTACTGFVGARGTAVPEPSSYLWLMGAGFGLIVLVFERRRRRTA